MRKLYYEPFISDRRTELVRQCIKSIDNGQSAVYILPSREAMFHVRQLFTQEMGGRFGCHIFGFEDFERMIVGEALENSLIAGDLEQRFVLKYVLNQLPQHNVFNKVKNKSGFVQTLIHTIRRLKRLNISPDEFLTKTAMLEGSLLKKCECFQYIYSNYEKVKQSKDIIDIDDISLKAVTACKNADIFKNAGVIVIDGFINIDAVNVQLIKNICEQYPDISVYANVPFKNINNQQFLFDEVIKDFTQLGFEMVENKPHRSTVHNACLQMISENLYCNKVSVKADCDNFQICNSPCIDHEVRFTAGKIKQLIQDTGVKPPDIAVVVADIESYKSKAIEVFKEYGIPINIKNSSKLTHTSVIKDIIALWLSEDPLDAIPASKYISPTEFICGCENGLKAFEQLLREVQIEKNICALYSKGLIDSELWLRDIMAVEQFKNIFNTLRKAYEQLSKDNICITTRDFINDMLDVLDSREVQAVNRDTGGVRFIPPDLLRGQSYDTVFVLGVNEGIFPSSSNSGGLFDAYETNLLFQMGINVNSAEWEIEREKIRFNCCIASACNKLYISYRTADEDGSIMIASPFIDEVISVLDKQSIENVVGKPVSMRDRVSFKAEPFSVAEAVKKIATQLRNGAEFIQHDIGSTVLCKLEYPSHASSVEFSREIGRKFDLYDGKLSNAVIVQQDAGYGFSASQLNSYAKCPFTYFVQRVLGIEAEDEGLRELFDIGAFYHSVLKEYNEDNKNPCTADIERLNDIFAQKIQFLALDSVHTAFKMLVEQELLTTLQNFIRHDAQNMSRYFETTGFMLLPAMLEVGFKIKLGEQGSIIRGAADRVDLEVDSNGGYTGRFIIYDYKKGKINGIRQCIEGKDFQLSLYHNAFADIIKSKFNIAEPECLALLYYSIEKLTWDGIIRADIKKALFEGKKGTRSTPSKDGAEVVLSWAENEALNVINKIRNGYFMPAKQCPASSMFPCAYSGMCRYDKVRIARKAGDNNA